MSEFVVSGETMETLRSIGIEITGALGKNNRVIVDDANAHKDIIKLSFNGYSDNCILLGSSVKLWCRASFMGDGNKLVIARSSQALNMECNFYGNSSVLSIKSNVSANHVAFTVFGPSGMVTVGEECMFSWGVGIHTHDFHAIIDFSGSTPMQINKPQNIVIDPYVWLAQDVLIMKGVTIGRGAIIGARSVVTTNIPAFSLAVGTPAIPVRHNVTWSRAWCPTEAQMRESVNERIAYKPT